MKIDFKILQLKNLKVMYQEMGFLKKKVKNFIKLGLLFSLISFSALAYLFIFGTGKLIKNISLAISPKKVYEIPIYLPEQSNISVNNSYDYMNSLMISPFWYVNNKNGNLYAYARSYDKDGDSFDLVDDDYFLFEYQKDFFDNVDNSTIMIGNGGIAETGGSQPESHQNFSTPAYTYALDVSIGNEKIDSKYITDCDMTSKTCKLDVSKTNSYGRIGKQLSSSFILPIGENLYLEIKEVSPDKERTRTKRVIENIITELNNYISPEKTCIALSNKNSNYAAFFGMLFKNTENLAYLEKGIGLQDRFTFYGYIQPEILKDSLSPISIMISSEEVCSGECTQSPIRTKKAEYLGKSNCKGIPHFFSIEDNALYLSSDKDSKFGYFSGETRFSADVSIVQDGKSIYSQNFDGFTGWER